MKKILTLLLPLIIFLTLASPALAQFTPLKDANCVYRGTVTIDCAPQLVKNIIYWMLIFAGTVALFFVILGGFKLLTSGGDPKGVGGAKKTITWALIGLVIILSSFLILNVIAKTTGLGCIERFGFGQCGTGAKNNPAACSDANPRGTCGAGRSCIQYPSGSGHYSCHNI